MSLVNNLLDSKDEIDPELVPEIIPVDAVLSIIGPTEELRSLFQAAASVVPAKEIIKNSSFLHLSANAANEFLDSNIYVTATDGEQTISLHSENVNVLVEGSQLLPAKKLYEILRAAPGTKTKIEVIGNEARITSKNAVWSLQLVSSSFRPVIPNVTDVTLIPIDSRPLLAALNAVFPAVAKDRESLKQVSLVHGALTACDGARLHRQKIEDFPKDLKFDIPASSVPELMRVLRNNSELAIGISDTAIIFKLEESLYSIQKFLLPFPNVEELILGPALSNEAKLTFDKKEFEDSVKRVTLVTDPDTLALKMTLSAGKRDASGEPVWNLFVHSTDRQGNRSQEIIECSWNGSTSKELTLNYRFLLDFVSANNNDTITFMLGNDSKTDKKPVFMRDDLSGFTGVLQQMSIK